MASKVSVHIIEAKELVSADVGGSSDPYCVVSVPGTHIKARTRAIKSTLTPMWDEKFDLYPVNVNETKALLFQVFDKDLITFDDPIGQCEVALEKLESGRGYHVWLPLKGVSTGQIRVKIEVNRARDTNTSKQVENTILEYCKRNNCKYEDKEFPAADSSIYKKGPGPHSNVIVWKRPSEFTTNPRLFVDGVESGDVIQGALGDCYFLGAISVVATRRDLLLPLFVASYPEYGFYQIKLFKDGQWQIVTIDDRIPMYGNSPIYGKCKDKDELWVPLIEKAYAKLHKCYEALNSGSIAAALTDLTGEGSQTLSFDEPDVQAMIKNGQLWQKMLYCVSENFLMGCSNNDDGPAEADTGMGILKNHAYGILDCKEPKPGLKMLCIRNPWGRLEWKGRFSDGSSDWTPELMNILKVKFEDDGTFWMTYEDFLQQYNNFIVLRLLQDEFGKTWTKSTFIGEFKPPNSGGCLNHPTWHDNPQYLLTTNQRTKTFITLTQPDARMRWEEDYTIGIGMYIMKTKDPRIRKVTYDKSDIVAKVTFTPARDVSCDLELEPGINYVLIVGTFEPNQQTKYWLEIYSEDPHKCVQIPNELGPSVNGEWRGASAGGCYNHTSWINNPKFCLTFAGPQPTTNTPVTILLRQEDRPQKYFIGMYTGKYNGKVPGRNEIEKMSTCVNAREVNIELDVKPGDWPQFVIPVTFDPGQQGSFGLIAYSTIPLKWMVF